MVTQNISLIKSVLMATLLVLAVITPLLSTAQPLTIAEINQALDELGGALPDGTAFSKAPTGQAIAELGQRIRTIEQQIRVHGVLNPVQQALDIKAVLNQNLLLARQGLENNTPVADWEWDNIRAGLQTKVGLAELIAEKEASRAASLAFKPEEGCGLTNLFSLACLKAALANLGTMLVGLVSLIPIFANVVFNATVEFSVRGFSSFYNDVPAIKNAWAIARDLVNVSLIFIVLYIAAGLVLQLSSVTGKKLLVRVIMVALLINFSGFITKVVIDASNVVANQFYSVAAAGEAASISGAPDIVSQLNKSFPLPWGDGVSVNESASRTFTTVIISTFGQVILNLITATVLFAGAVLFGARTVILIFLIILSPFAFLFMILPKTEKYAEQWRSALVSQAIFAPVYLFCIMLAIKIVSSGDGISTLLGATAGWTTMASAAKAILVYIIVNGLMLGSLIIAKKLGVAGANFADKAAKGMLGYATVGAAGTLGRNTIGRLANQAANSKGLEERASKGGFGGWAARQQLKTARKLAGSSFDVRASGLGKAAGLSQLGKAHKGGFAEDIKERIKKEEKLTESFSDENKEKYARNLGERRGITGVAAGVIGAGLGEIPGLRWAGRWLKQPVYKNELASEGLGRFKEKAAIETHNEGVKKEIETYKTDNDYAGQKRAVFYAEQEIKTKRETLARAKVAGQPTGVFDSELKVAESQLYIKTQKLQELDERVKEMSKKKKVLKKKEKSVKDQLKEALKEAETDRGDKGENKKEEKT